MSDEPLWPEARGASIWVNCACSLDGRLAFAGGERARLSSPEDLARVQSIRAGSDGILVGVGTVLKDDPSLRVHWDQLGRPKGRDPTRVVVDGSGRTPPGARVLDRSLPTIVATSEKSHRVYPPHVRRVVVGSARVDLGSALRATARAGGSAADGRRRCGDPRLGRSGTAVPPAHRVLRPGRDRGLVGSTDGRRRRGAGAGRPHRLVAHRPRPGRRRVRRYVRAPTDPGVGRRVNRTPSAPTLDS